MPCSLGGLAGALGALGSVVTAYVAYSALNQWKSKLRGTDRYTAARDVLVSLHELRDELVIARNPWQSAGTTADLKKEYMSRLSRLEESRRVLYEQAVIAEVLFQSEAREVLDAVAEVIRKLRIDAEIYFVLREDLDRGGSNDHDNALRMALKSILYDTGRPQGAAKNTSDYEHFETYRKQTFSNAISFFKERFKLALGEI